MEEFKEKVEGASDSQKNTFDKVKSEVKEIISGQDNKEQVKQIDHFPESKGSTKNHGLSGNS